MIQDDALPVPNFAAAVEKIAERNPTTPVCLFLGAAPASTAAAVRRASNRGKRYQPLLNTNFVPLVACMWPREKAEQFLRWSRGQKLSRADDGNAARWMRLMKQQFLVTIPSIVEHNDGVASVKGGREHQPWKESWRRALLLAEDALEYDW